MNLDAAPGFTGATLDRADNLRLEPGKIAALAADPSARMMRIAGLDPMLGADDRLVWERVPAGDIASLIFLGLQDGRPLFAPLAPSDADPASAFSAFAILGRLTHEDAALWATARSLVSWHSRHRYCSNCGAMTEPFRAGWGRLCGVCQTQHFPRVDPVVIMLAEHQGRVLVGRQPRFPAGRYSALAGFVEPGESVEEAVARELKEEAGLVVSKVRYIASQPWPFPSSLMIACIAQADDDAIALDETELEHAMWVDRPGVEAALAEREGAPFLAPPPYAIANTLFRRWLKSQDSQHEQ